jgi:glucose/arabinose dehydrogenase
MAILRVMPFRPIVVVSLLVGAVLFASAGHGATRPKYHFANIGRGFTEAVYVTSAPDDPATLYVVEQRGTIELARGGKPAGRFLDIRSEVLDEGEHGLLGFAFSPHYADDHTFYVDYTDRNGDTHVSQFTSQDGVGAASSERRLLFVKQPFPNHKGGMLAFDRRGRLYAGMGDGGTDPNAIQYADEANRAQDMNVQLGKLLRTDPSAPGASWQIAGLGLRNPWRYSFDRRTGDLWLADVGTHLFEEVDFIPENRLDALANFGWSRFEGRTVYNPSTELSGGTLVRPLYQYKWGVNQKCGIIGGYVYRGTRVPSARGRYFFGDLCNGNVWSLKRDAKGRVTSIVHLPGTVAQLSSFGEDARGELYAVALDGWIYQLVR